MTNQGSSHVAEGTLLWEPSAELIENGNITRYMRWLGEHRGLAFDGYADLWEWSVHDLEGFWSSVWEYFEIITHVYNIQRLKRAQGLSPAVEVPKECYWVLPEWDRSEP